MEQFDVCVIGNDLSAYASVATLQKNGHKVAHIKAFDHYLEDQFTPSKKNQKMNHEMARIGRTGISQELLAFLNMDDVLNKTQESAQHKVILKDGRVLTRGQSKADFRIYLIRHFPQHAEAIDRLMADIHTFYNAYAKALKPTTYHTESSVLDVWGKWATLSVDRWLDAYFTNPALKASVQCFSELYPAPLSEITVKEYFILYITAFEEDGAVSPMTFSDWVKAFKKKAPATYYTSALERTEFNGLDYTVRLKNNTEFVTRFILGDATRPNAEAITYRWLDIAVDPAWLTQSIKVPIHFRMTPLFDHLKIIPWPVLNQKLPGYVRIEVVSEADKALILTFVDRHFKGFESHIIEAIERQPFRRNETHLYDDYAVFHHLEVSDDLWDAPKWMQVPMNNGLKKPLLERLLKGVYFGLEMDQAIQLETSPKRSSIMVQAAEQLMLRMHAAKTRTITLQAGYQSLSMKVEKSGAERIERADQTIQMSVDTLMQLNDHPQKADAVEADDSLKRWFTKAIKKGSRKDALRLPYWGMIANAFVLMLLWVLDDAAFIAFTFGAWLIFKETIYLMRYRTFTRFESVLGTGLVVLSFFLVLVPINMGVFWIFLGLTLFILNPHISGVLDREFTFDPVRNELSKKYLKTFNLRMSQAISLSFILLGLSYGISVWFAPVILFVISAFFIRLIYLQDKRDYIEFRSEEFV